MDSVAVYKKVKNREILEHVNMVLSRIKELFFYLTFVLLFKGA